MLTPTAQPTSMPKSLFMSVLVVCPSCARALDNYARARSRTLSVACMPTARVRRMILVRARPEQRTSTGGGGLIIPPKFSQSRARAPGFSERSGSRVLPHHHDPLNIAVSMSCATNIIRFLN